MLQNIPQITTQPHVPDSIVLRLEKTLLHINMIDWMDALKCCPLLIILRRNTEVLWFQWELNYCLGLTMTASYMEATPSCLWLLRPFKFLQGYMSVRFCSHCLDFPVACLSVQFWPVLLDSQQSHFSNRTSLSSFPPWIHQLDTVRSRYFGLLNTFVLFTLT